MYQYKLASDKQEPVLVGSLVVLNNKHSYLKPSVTNTIGSKNNSKMNEPNQTLYVANIDWKVKKPILRRALHTLFNRHGKVC